MNPTIKNNDIASVMHCGLQVMNMMNIDPQFCGEWHSKAEENKANLR
jgi:hypothetical protein